MTNKTETGIYLSLLPNAQCKSEQVKGNASSKHTSDYHCHQRPGIGYLETISNHKPTNKSRLQSLKHKPSHEACTAYLEIYFYAYSSNRYCSVIIKWTIIQYLTNSFLLTSCRWPTSFLSTTRLGVLTSRCKISLSRLPDDRTSPFQASAPTLAEWPCNLLTCLFTATSHTCT